MNKLNDIQRMITDLVERNKVRYGLTNISSIMNPLIVQNNLQQQQQQQKNNVNNKNNNSQLLKVNDNSDDDQLISPRIIAPSTNKQSTTEQCVVLEVDDGDDADIISLMIDSEVPSNFEICNLDQLPGNEPLHSIYQTFTKVFRAKITSAKQFSAQFDYIIQSLFVKLRRLTPCALAGLRFKVDASAETDIIQISLIGSVVGIRNLNESLACKNGLGLYLPTHCYQEKKAKIPHDSEHVFENDDEACDKIEIPASISSVFELSNRGNPACVELTTLNHLGPKCKILKYIGVLTFPFIREVTSVREYNGLHGFMTSFLNEVLLMVRTHIVSLDGNALVSMNINQLVLLHNPHKNQVN